MKEPHWIAEMLVLAVHERQIAEHGGAEGIRDRGLLDSALARPRNLFLYERSASLARLVASYCLGISRNDPFVDGNKRVAYVVARTFLLQNNHDIVVVAEEKYTAMMAVANERWSEEQLSAWFEKHLLTLD